MIFSSMHHCTVHLIWRIPQRQMAENAGIWWHDGMAGQSYEKVLLNEIDFSFWNTFLYQEPCSDSETFCDKENWEVFLLCNFMKYLLSDSFEFYLLLFCDNLVGKLFKLLTPKHLGRTRPKLSYNNISLFQRQNWKSSYHTISTIAFSNTKH